jgi:hypothetical protein
MLNEQKKLRVSWRQVSEVQFKKILAYIESGKSEGARLLTGGGRPAHIAKGYFVAPTVFVGVRPEMKIWREEIFGPVRKGKGVAGGLGLSEVNRREGEDRREDMWPKVRSLLRSPQCVRAPPPTLPPFPLFLPALPPLQVLSVAEFETEAEAIALANDSEFGLGGAVISECPDRCRRVFEALECGIVWVNCSQPAFPQAPWGGVKNSGFGRDLGEWGLDNYLSVKQVTRYVNPGIWEWYPQAPSKL